jgi:hypothetical protein
LVEKAGERSAVLKTYIVYEPSGARADAVERAEFVREKFSWSALFFTPLWLLFNQLWVALAIYAAAIALIASGSYLSQVNYFVALVALLLPSAVVAFECAQLKRFRLLQLGYRETDIVIAADLESAERRYFERRKSPPPRTNPPPTPPNSPEMYRPASSVIGLFPERGR